METYSDARVSKVLLSCCGALYKYCMLVVYTMCHSIWYIMKYSSARDSVLTFLIVYTVNYTDFFDFGVCMGDAQLERLLDGSSPPINLSTPIQFFGRTQHTLFVSQLCILSLTYIN